MRTIFGASTFFFQKPEEMLSFLKCCVFLFFFRFVQVKREFEVNAFDGFDPKDFTEERLEKEWNEYSKI